MEYNKDIAPLTKFQSNIITGLLFEVTANFALTRVKTK